MTTADPRDAARLLGRAMVRLRARLRAESAPDDMRWSWSQVTTLHRIAEEGPTTVSALAVAEHVRPQSMAETVAALRQAGTRRGRVRPHRRPEDARVGHIRRAQAHLERRSRA
jgi:DNA-binding MarR family transcriptional regulator